MFKPVPMGKVYADQNQLVLITNDSSYVINNNTIILLRF